MVPRLGPLPPSSLGFAGPLVLFSPKLVALGILTLATLWLPPPTRGSVRSGGGELDLVGVPGWDRDDSAFAEAFGADGAAAFDEPT